MHDIHLEIDENNAPYVLTKPFHHSQKIIEEKPSGAVVICIKAHINFELERLILGFGETLKVLKPRHLRKRIQKKMNKAAEQYL